MTMASTAMRAAAGLGLCVHARMRAGLGGQMIHALCSVPGVIQLRRSTALCMRCMGPITRQKGSSGLDGGSTGGACWGTPLRPRPRCPGLRAGAGAAPAACPACAARPALQAAAAPTQRAPHAHLELELGLAADDEWAC